MHLSLIIIGILALNTPCQKGNSVLQRSATELLTQKEWVLTSHGYDVNRNGIVDVSEENIQDCQKDNISVFRVNGTGSQFENAALCGTGISEQFFTWKFINHATALDFSTGIVNILRLNEDELIIYHDIADVNGQFSRFMTVFKH